MGQTTEDVWRDHNTGEWEPQREAWHQAFANDYIEGKTPAVGRAPKAIILGGGTASGKTNLAKKLGMDDPNAVHIDADAIKPQIPEFDQLREQEGTQPTQTQLRNPNLATTRVHEESSYIAKLALAKAVAGKLDVIYDATSSGRGGGTLAGIVNKLSSEGYEIHGLFVDVPIEEAMQRAERRAADASDPAGFGRHIPAEAMKTTHTGSAANFMLMKNSPMFKSIKLYDTRGKIGSEPTLVYSKINREQGQVLDNAKWEEYKKKAASAT